jgi:hypothetical protein
MEHICNQDKKFEEISGQVAILKQDLDDHRKIQQEQDIAREEHRLAQKINDRAVDKKLDALGKQMESLIALNTEVSNIKIAWKVGTSAGATIVKIVLAITVLLGALYAVKGWFKK